MNRLQEKKKGKGEDSRQQEESTCPRIETIVDKIDTAHTLAFKLGLVQFGEVKGNNGILWKLSIHSAHTTDLVLGIKHLAFSYITKCIMVVHVPISLHTRVCVYVCV